MTMPPDQPRSLRSMLTASKDTAGLMVDLAYGAVYFGDPDMAGEVERLWDDLTTLAHGMRVVAILAGRTRREAEEMAEVLQVVEAMEDLGRDAVEISRIASPGVGLPPGLLAALSDSESMVGRVKISAGSPFTDSALSSFRLPVDTGCRIIAVRRGGDWDTDIDGATRLETNDIVVLVGPQRGLARVREFAGEPPAAAETHPEEGAPTDTDHAVDVLIDMRTLSEVAVGLAYAALLTGDPGLADEVGALAERLDHLKEELQTWVLRAAHTHGDTFGLASLLLLSQAAEDLGDRAADMVRHVTATDPTHPVLALALGESEEVAERAVVAHGAPADGATLGHVTAGTGFDVLVVRRDGRDHYRPSRDLVLRVGDELIATGPREGHGLLSTRCRPL